SLTLTRCADESMTQELFDNLATVLFFIVFALAWVVPALVAMQLVTPRLIVERYFKKPHFNLGETIVLSHFPGSLMRTLIFMCGCISETYRIGRKLDNYLDIAPRWYIMVSRLYISAVLAHTLLAIGLMLALYFCDIET